MKIIIKFLKGILIGLGSILPGVSGGMIAAAFNVYEELVKALDSFIKAPFKAVFSIWEYLFGILIGFGIGFILIATVLKLFPLPITMLFIGLIIGGIPSFIKEVNVEKKQVSHYVVLILSAILVLSVLLLKPTEINSLGSPWIYFIYILIGILVALSLIIPGLSGTMILMAIGVYTFFTTAFSEFIMAILKFNIADAFVYLPSVLIIGVSTLITLLITSKVINKVLINHRVKFNMAILGILIVSPINILWSLYLENNEIYKDLNLFDYISSIIVLIIGIFIAYKLIKTEVEVNE